MPITGYVSGCLGSVQGSAFDPATNAWVTAVISNGGTVSVGRQTIVDTLIRGLKSDGIWSKLDRLWVLAAENTPSALTDMVVDALATAVNSPTFTTDRGYTGDGATAYIDTNFNANTATSPNFVQDSASLFAWSNTAGQGGDMIGTTSETKSQINQRFTDNNCYYSLNGNTGASFANASDVTGLYLDTRTSSSVIRLDVNGSNANSASGNTSTTPSNFDFCILRAAGTFSSRQVCCGGFGSQMSATDSTNLYNRLRTYMTAVGVP